MGQLDRFRIRFWWMPMKLQVEYHEITITLPMSTTTLVLDYHNQPVSTIEQPFCSTEIPLHNHYQPSNYHGGSIKNHHVSTTCRQGRGLTLLGIQLPPGQPGGLPWRQRVQEGFLELPGDPSKSVTRWDVAWKVLAFGEAINGTCYVMLC